MRYEGSNPSLCTRVSSRVDAGPERSRVLVRLYMAMIAFVVLGAAAWMTLTDQRLRLITLAILAMFAVKTWVRRKEIVRPDRESDVEQ
jgi:uncharacterized membrane protein YfcA